jgi:hypothetical protein
MTMMLAYDGDWRAELIARTVPVVARERADHAAVDDWASAQARDDYVMMLRGMEAWTEGPEWDRVVVVRPRMCPADGYWTGVAGEILDVAADRVDTEAGDSFTFEHGRIEDDPGSKYGARLVCARKPNLERAFHPLWHGYDPMVAVVLDGVEYFLGWSAQRLAVTIANRYPWRHDFSRKVFAHNLLLLANHLGIDPAVAVRLAWIVAPDHCGVYLERNQALRILSEDEEQAVRVSGVFVRAAAGVR